MRKTEDQGVRRLSRSENRGLEGLGNLGLRPPLPVDHLFVRFDAFMNSKKPLHLVYNLSKLSLIDEGNGENTE